MHPPPGFQPCVYVGESICSDQPERTKPPPPAFLSLRWDPPTTLFLPGIPPPPLLKNGCDPRHPSPLRRNRTPPTGTNGAPPPGFQPGVYVGEPHCGSDETGSFPPPPLKKVCDPRPPPAHPELPGPCQRDLRCTPLPGALPGGLGECRPEPVVFAGRYSHSTCRDFEVLLSSVLEISTDREFFPECAYAANLTGFR